MTTVEVKADLVDGAAVARRLVEWRGERSQADVARAIGTTQESWSKYERDRRLTLEMAVRICQHFGKTMAELTGVEL